MMLLRGVSRRMMPGVASMGVRSLSVSATAAAAAAGTGAEHVVRSRFPDMQLPQDVDLATYVMERFDQYGDRTAIIDHFSQKSVSFSTLKAQTHAFGAALQQELGFQKGDCIGLVSPNDVTFFPATFGPSLAGCVTSPVNPLFLEEEIAKQMVNSGAKALAAHPAMLDKCARVAEELDIPLIVLGGEAGPKDFAFDDLMDRYMGQSPSAVDIDPVNDIVLLPYSSGTSGPPKGVMLTHYNIVANVEQCTPGESRFIQEGTACLCPLPFFHIYGLVVGLNAALRNGGVLVTMPRFDLEVALSAITEHKVERVHAVPPLILAFAKHPLIESDKYDLSSLRAILSGAAPLGAELADQCAARLGCVVRQAWGMTELSPAGTITPDDLAEGRTGASGTLVPNTEGRICNPEDANDVLPPHESGEIQLRGPQVMKGYLNREEATKETILDDGWLRTGDIGHFDSEGFLHVTDRCKELIKVKGFQVAPAELEAVIGHHTHVADVVVVGVEDEEHGEVPRAYVQVKPDHELTEQEVIDYVHEHVAHYKRLRGGAEIVPEVPRSPSGKLLRRVVREWVK